MSENHLDKALPFLKRIDEERREQFYEYFKTAPEWLLDSFVVEKLEKGKIFIREGNPVDMIYLIGEGVIKATDYRVHGISFDFMLFTKVYAYGGMEVIMELEKYRASLQAVTDCTVLKIPKTEFSQWLHTDIQALSYESKLMAEYLLEQARSVRAFLFLQGADRLAMLFSNRYEKYANNGILKINNNRQELSDFTGLSVKTITRAVKKLKEDSLIEREGNYIIINKEKYVLLKEHLSKIVSNDD